MTTPPEDGEPLVQTERVLESALWSVREAQCATDPAVRTLHIRRVVRLITTAQAIILGIP